MAPEGGSYDNLLVDIEDGVATITINRPDVLNALSAETTGELGAAVDILAADERVRALIITGAGDRAFVAGADIGVLATTVRSRLAMPHTSGNRPSTRSRSAANR